MFFFANETEGGTGQCYSRMRFEGGFQSSVFKSSFHARAQGSTSCACHCDRFCRRHTFRRKFADQTDSCTFYSVCDQDDRQRACVLSVPLFVVLTAFDVDQFELSETPLAPGATSRAGAWNRKRDLRPGPTRPTPSALRAVMRPAAKRH